MWRSIAVAAVALFVAAGGGCSDDDQEVFSFAKHDLCEWVTEEEVAEFVAAEFDWDGAVTEAELSWDIDDDAACQWELSSTGDTTGVVIAGDAARWRDFDGNLVDLDEQIGWRGTVDYEGGATRDGTLVLGHPELSQGVAVYNDGFGMFAFGVPPETEWLWLFLDVPGNGETELGGWETVEPKWFAVADHFVAALGWLPPPQ